MDTTQTTPEQSGSQSDTLVGSVIKPIVLDETSNQESSIEAYPAPSRSSIVIAAQTILEQSRYRLNGLVGSVTNLIILDDINDQERSVEVYSSLGRGPMSSPFNLKRKRSVSDDRDPNQAKTNAKFRFVGPREYNSHPNSKQAVQPSCIDQVAIQKLSKDPDVIVSEECKIGYEYDYGFGEEIWRQQRLRKLCARRDKLMEQVKDIWREIHKLEAEY